MNFVRDFLNCWGTSHEEFSDPFLGRTSFSSMNNDLTDVQKFINYFVTIDQKYHTMVPPKLDENANSVGWKMTGSWKYLFVRPGIKAFILAVVIIATHILNIYDTTSYSKGTIWYGVILNNVDQFFALMVCFVLSVSKGIWWSYSTIAITLAYDAMVIVFEIIAYGYPSSAENSIIGTLVLISVVLRDIPYVVLYTTLIRVLRQECENMMFLTDYFDENDKLYDLLPSNTHTFFVVVVVSSTFNALMLLILVHAMNSGIDWKILWLISRILLPVALLTFVLIYWVAREDAIKSFIKTNKERIKEKKKHIAALIKLEIESNTSILSKSLLAANLIPFALFLVSVIQQAYFN